MLGYSFEQLAKIISMLEDQRNAGVCLDTAHAYGAGYDVKSRKGYEKTFQQFEEVMGLEFMRAMHINDSKVPLGSRKDRHEQIGEGFIGLEGFGHFMNDDRCEGIPRVPVAPAGHKAYKKELKALRSMIKR